MTCDSTWVERALRDLVSIPSVSGEEKAAQAYVDRLMNEAGATTVRHIPVRPTSLQQRFNFRTPTTAEDMVSVVGTWEGNGPGPHIVLNGHVDTVPPSDAWTDSPFTSEVGDSALTGLGAVDMKGGLVGAIAGVGRAAKDGTLKGTVEIHSVPDEEAGGGTGSLACVEALMERGTSVDLVVVCEPTNLHLATAQVGSRALRFRFLGREAHANRKHEGRNAIEGALEFFSDLEAWISGLAAELHPLLPPRAVNIGSISGGTGATQVAGLAEMELCVTYHPSDTDACSSAMDKWIDRWDREHAPDLTVEATELHNVRPFVTEGNAAIVQTLRQAGPFPVASIVGFPAGSDGRLYDEYLDTHVIIFGPGDLRFAHRPDERIPLPEIDVFAETIRRFVSKPIN